MVILKSLASMDSSVEETDRLLDALAKVNQYQKLCHDVERVRLAEAEQTKQDCLRTDLEFDNSVKKAEAARRIANEQRETQAQQAIDQVDANRAAMEHLLEDYFQLPQWNVPCVTGVEPYNKSVTESPRHSQDVPQVSVAAGPLIFSWLYENDTAYRRQFDSKRASVQVSTFEISRTSSDSSTRLESASSLPDASVTTALSPSFESLLHISNQLSSWKKRFLSGMDVVVICPTTEAEQGFFVCRVLEIDNPSSLKGQCLVKLARLHQYHGSSTLYCLTLRGNSTTEKVILETEGNLFPVSAKIVESVPAATTGDITLIYSVDLPELAKTSQNATTDNRTSPNTMSVFNVLISQAGSSLRSDVAGYFRFDTPRGAALQLVNLRSRDQLKDICEGLMSNLIIEVMQTNPTVGNLILANDSVRWELVSTYDKVTIFSKKLPKLAHFHCFIARVHVQASPSEVRSVLKNAQSRETFDPMCLDSNTIETIDESTTITHFTNQTMLVTRDFCVLRHDRVMPNGSVYFAVNSIHLPATCPQTNVVRGLVIDSGFAIEPVGKGESTLYYIVQSDLMGFAPKLSSIATAWVIQRQVASVVKNLRQFFAMASVADGQQQ